MIPQAIITLAPSGALQLELPGANGARRVIALSGEPRDTIDTISRVLHGQLTGQIDIGLDGAPTQAQTDHWTSHAIFRDAACAFCQVELSRELPRDRKARAKRDSHEAGRGVKVTRIASKVSGRAKPKAIPATLEECGL